MSYYKKRKHEGEVKRCPSCTSDGMRFIPHINSWNCSNCNAVLREDFYQVPLFTDRENELDEIAPDVVRQDSPFYFKSIGKRESDYEDSVNLSLSEDEHKYSGSAQRALELDAERFNQERSRAAHVRYMQSRSYYSDIVGNDSTEVQLDKHRARRMKELQDHR